MRSSQSTEAYEQYVSGMLKDIAFHELLMEVFRKENAQDELFDGELAFDILDRKKTGTVSAYELQGFLDLQGYKFKEDSCQQVISAIDKSLPHMKRHTLVNMLLPQDKQLRMNSLRRHDRIQISVKDFDYWKRVRTTTQHRLENYLVKEASFFQELLERRKSFCHTFYGDIYSLMNYFGHKEKINEQMVYDFMKRCRVLFNGDEYKALIRRSVHRDSSDQTAKIFEITKSQLADLLLTKNLNMKETFSRRDKLEKPSYYHFNRSAREKQQQNNRKPQPSSEDPYYSALMMEPPKGLKYKFHSPQAQIQSTGNLYLLSQQFRELGIYKGLW